MTDQATFNHQLGAIRDRMATAAVAAGRNPRDVTLLAVSKTFPAEAVGTALACGMTQFGESRVQEALPKMAEVGELPESQGKPIEWHLIGHLQKNKVAKAVGEFALIHSVDSLALAERINRIAGEHRVIQDVLLQINASGEEQKHGIPADQALAAVQQAGTLPHIRVKGLMGMAERGNPEPAFITLAKLFETLRQNPPQGVEMAELSMGMSGDFEAAIRHGATMVRVGSALFGERDR